MQLINSIVKNHIRTFSVLVSITFVNAVLGILTTIKLANILGPTSYGEIVYGFALGGMLSVIIRFGTDKSLVREYIYSPENVARVFVIVNWLKLIIFTIVTLISIIWLVFDVELNISLVTVIVSCGVAVSGFQMQSIYDAKKKTTIHARFFLIHRVFYFSCVWFVIIFFQDVFTNMIPAIFSLIAVLIYLSLQYQGALKLMEIESFKFCLEDLKVIINNNWLFAISSILVIGVTSVSQIIIVNKIDLAALGVYGVCFQFVSLASIVVKQVSRVGKRELILAIKENKIKIGLLILIYVSFIMLSISPIALACILFSQYILTNLFGVEYLSGVPLLKIMGFYIFTHAFMIAVEQIAIAVGLRATNLVANGINGIIVCGVSFLFISKLGSEAVALALVYGSISASIVTLIFIFNKKYKKTGKSLYY